MNTETSSLGDQWRNFREEGMSSLQNRTKAAAVFDTIDLRTKVPKDIIKAVPSMNRIARRHWDL